MPQKKDLRELAMLINCSRPRHIQNRESPVVVCVAVY